MKFSLGFTIASIGLVGGAVVVACGRPSPLQNGSSPPIIDNVTSEDRPGRIPDDQIEREVQRARSGDIEAAELLGNHYRESGQRNLSRRWHGIGAARGHCRSILALREMAEDAQDSVESNRLRNSLRQHACTFGKVYPSRATNETASVPLWED